jgi:hypothetical protein
LKPERWGSPLVQEEKYLRERPVPGENEIIIIIIAQGDYIHRYNQANIFHQELATKCGLSKGPPTPYHKYEPQSVLEISMYTLYYDRSTITDPAIHSRPDKAILTKPSKNLT